MRRIRSLDFELEPSAVCIGKFDGIHRGHRLLIQAAKKTKLPVVMLPLKVLARMVYTVRRKKKTWQRKPVWIFLSLFL